MTNTEAPATTIAADVTPAAAQRLARLVRDLPNLRVDSARESFGGLRVKASLRVTGTLDEQRRTLRWLDLEIGIRS